MAGSSSIAQVVGTSTLLAGVGRGSSLEAAGTHTLAEAPDSKPLVAAELDTEPACNR